MAVKVRLILILHIVLFGSTVASTFAAADEPKLALVAGERAACQVIVVADGNPTGLIEQAAKEIATTVERWGATKLPIVKLSQANGKVPAEPCIVLATLRDVQKLAPDTVSAHSEFDRIAEIDEQGFALVPVMSTESQQLFIVSQTPRGVYNGAQYLRDFCIDGETTNLYADFRPYFRAPQLGGRTAYTLTIWGQESQYTADNWATIFRTFAHNGMDRVYFWVSGHFPSKQFPQTYKCNDIQDGKQYDTTVNTKIGSVADLKKIVTSAHDLGLKIYLGGALGGWCGTQFITNLDPATLKVGHKEQSLCPSNPKVRQALIAYYAELFDALPEADGLFIESADEAGDCGCSECAKSIDALGSKQFGQSQLSLCQEIMGRVWRDHPHAHLAYTIGYQEHAKDVAYYRLIRQLSKDPRFEWMEARNSWSFPGSDGQLQPASSFSNRVLRWKQYYNKPLEELIAEANRAQREGLYGMAIAFEPGYATGSFYKEVPFPTEILPYALTGFAFREATWEPTLTAEQMRERVQKRFFGADAPKTLGDDLWTLREIIRTRKGADQINAIEMHIKEARMNASPKTSEGLALMTRAVNDIHKYITEQPHK